MKSKTAGLIFVLVTFASLSLFTQSAKAENIPPLFLPDFGALRISSVVVEHFDRYDAWEAYSSPAGVQLGVRNGAYHTYAALPGYIWGLNAEFHTNVVVEVQMTPLTMSSDIGAGVMCRADASNDGDGYYFMINANGYYAILIGRGAEIVPLVNWQPSDAIHTGVDHNTIGAVCLGNQLAMYVNGELVTQVVDDTYSSGVTGLAAAAGSSGVEMTFDNLTLYTISAPGV